MSEYMFGVKRGKMAEHELRRRETAAEAEGCTHNYVNDPGQGYLAWFAGPNRGDPFDRDLAKRVQARLDDEA